jgi:hypothetical protein
LQRYIVDIGALGPDKGKGGKFLVLPPGYGGKVPSGYFVARSPTYSAMLGLRGFQVGGKTDEAVGLMKQIKVYPLAKASSPPPMEFLNGSNKDIDTVFPDNIRYFELLAMLVNEEPSDLFDPSERSQMRAIGILRQDVEAQRCGARRTIRRRRPRIAMRRQPWLGNPASTRSVASAVSVIRRNCCNANDLKVVPMHKDCPFGSLLGAHRCKTRVITDPRTQLCMRPSGIPYRRPQ